MNILCNLRACTLLAFVLAATAEPVPRATLSIPGKAISGGKELAAEIRGVCFSKDSGEVDFVVLFKTVKEADAFFPFGVFEGPDGQAANMQLTIAREPKPVTLSVKSGAAGSASRMTFC